MLNPPPLSISPTEISSRAARAGQSLDVALAYLTNSEQASTLPVRSVTEMPFSSREIEQFDPGSGRTRNLLIFRKYDVV